MQTQERVEMAGEMVVVLEAEALVIGSGAAGLAATERLVREYENAGVENPTEKVALATRGLGKGTSNNCGSDKQTYYKMGTNGDDSAGEFAATLTAGGSCDGDTALIEGAGSLRSFYHLVNIGVPFPHDKTGHFVGYKTDHDPRRRGTSAGPWTSRFMVQTLQREVERLGVRIYNQHYLVAILRDAQGAAGALFLNLTMGARDRFVLIQARNIIMAAGGPGELFRDSVYAHGQMGPYRALLEAGAEARNLTEMQFGLASVDPRWNVSGTYQQAIPRYFSTDADGGDERDFLNPYFETTADMATAIFLKGYQWPFDPDRMANAGSSLVDCAVYHERAIKGRRVYMDYRENPRPVEEGGNFDISTLGDEAREYLERSGVDRYETPIERLEAMNPPSIELYSGRGVDLWNEPLEVGVCAQHCNGGFSVDRWWESTTLPHCFVVGELAGTHGVKRPGGSALNAGQVGAYRAAQRVARVRRGEVDFDAVMHEAENRVEEISGYMDVDRHQVDADALAEAIQARMSDACGMLRSHECINAALDATETEWRRVQSDGLKVERWRSHVVLEVLELLFCARTWLTINRAYLEAGAGSRGSHLVLDPDGAPIHPLLPAEWRCKGEDASFREKVLSIRYDQAADRFDVDWQALRKASRPENDWFETVWSRYRSGDVFLS